MDKRKLENLIDLYAMARANFAYARGLRAGIDGTGQFLRDPEVVLADYKREQDLAEADLYHYLDCIEEEEENHEQIC